MINRRDLIKLGAGTILLPVGLKGVSDQLDVDPDGFKYIYRAMTFDFYGGEEPFPDYSSFYQCQFNIHGNRIGPVPFGDHSLITHSVFTVLPPYFDDELYHRTLRPWEGLIALDKHSEGIYYGTY